MLFLRIEDGDGVRKIRVDREPLVIGRGERADVEISEPKASREHLRVTPSGSGVVIHDLGSRNGTWLGDRRVLTTRLHPGEALRVGDSVLLLFEEDPTREPNAVRTIFSALVAPVILLALTLLAVHAAGSSREREVEAARRRLEAAEYGLARLPARRSLRDPEAEYEALRAFLEAHPDSRYEEDARAELARLESRVGRIRKAREDLATLAKLREENALPFAELYYRYEKLLESCSDLPEVAGAIREEFLELDTSHRERLEALVSRVCRDTSLLAAEGEFGRAASLLSSFTRRNPAAAAGYEEQLAAADARVSKAALYAYRDLMSRADALVTGGRPEKAAELLRGEAGRFLGTRFRALLLSRAEGLASRAGGRPPTPAAEDERSRRRSYALLAEEAEELAAAGYFLRAADKYAEIQPSVTIPEIREEFRTREKELRALTGLIEDVRNLIRKKGSDFGSVSFGDQRYRVLALTGDTLKLGFGKGELTREWGALTPEEELALLRAAKPDPSRRLLLAVYCFYLSLRTDYEVEIIEGLSHEETRETAGRLYARKEGRPYPPGGFLAFKGRILTRAEYAEEVHREQVAKLRGEQAKLLAKLRDHPTFRRLEKLRALRADLEKARRHALALIFDEQKYFYPYRDRMKEYLPVQKEVDLRVAAVKKIWDDPTRFTPREDPGMRRILKEIGKVGEELEKLGADSREFQRDLDRLTMYLGVTLTVRTFFSDRSELAANEYNTRVLEYNESLESVANPLEKRQVRITNEYRIMMGRRALVLDDRLVTSARGHSEEMSRLGYFSHFSPTPGRRTPDLRAKLAGYKGSAVSENIHRGSGDPEGAHHGWTHSSGHHRNLLRRFWTEMGTGQVGNIWTQNFGRTKPREFPAKKSEDR